MEDQYFQKSWQTARNFSEVLKVFKGILTKFLILKTSFAGIFRNMHFLCAKNWPPEAVSED